MFNRSPIGFPTQWRHTALVGRQAYRLRLRPGRRPRQSRDACTASNVILYTTLKASSNYIKLTYSTDSCIFYWFFFHLLRMFTSMLTFSTKDQNKNYTEYVHVGTNYSSSVASSFLSESRRCCQFSFVHSFQSNKRFLKTQSISSALQRADAMTLFFRSVPKNMNEYIQCWRIFFCN